MFFSKKEVLTKEEIDEQLATIDYQLETGEYAEAMSLIKQLEKSEPNQVAYHLGLIYRCGWGVEPDEQKARMYFSKALSVTNNYTDYTWYFHGLYCFNDRKYDDAIKAFKIAEEYGVEYAPVLLATTYSSAALDYRNLACRTLKMNELTQLNAVATKYAVLAENKYMEVADKFSDTMEIAHWVSLGRMAQLLYNMACRGELSMDISSDNSFGTWMQNSFKMMGGRYNDEMHQKMWGNVVTVCDFMDEHGMSVVAEYFRAACGLLDCELHSSAEALYRVRWHMKKVGELRATMQASASIELAGYMTDVTESFKKMDKKYGSYIVGMISAGQLPNISIAYPEGKAPAVESCENFMQMYHEIANAPKRTSNNTGFMNKGKKGLFGFLKK